MLKRMTLTILFLPVFMAFSMAGPNSGAVPGPAKLHAAPLPDNGVIVYQFHRRFRCEACHTLEAAINETIKTHFSNELEAGRLIFKVIDLDAEGSKRYSEVYDFFFNTVIMVDMENGKETRFKNLEEVWDLTDKKDAAMEFIRSHIAEYL